ncbi:hypothetical protein EK904_011327 [Melospiza melodia maxima]|nr:hypothetical protein EK904_011327 [Melospiza melodia maxima]
MEVVYKRDIYSGARCLSVLCSLTEPASPSHSPISPIQQGPMMFRGPAALEAVILTLTIVLNLVCVSSALIGVSSSATTAITKVVAQRKDRVITGFDRLQTNAQEREGNYFPDIASLWQNLDDPDGALSCAYPRRDSSDEIQLTLQSEHLQREDDTVYRGSAVLTALRLSRQRCQNKNCMSILDLISHL